MWTFLAHLNDLDFYKGLDEQREICIANTARANGDEGAEDRDARDSRFAGNTASNNGSDGFEISSGNQFASNTATGGDEIEVRGDGNKLAGNRSRMNGFNGMVMFEDACDNNPGSERSEGRPGVDSTRAPLFRVSQSVLRGWRHAGRLDRMIGGLHDLDRIAPDPQGRPRFRDAFQGL